jgi:hypothetical protein
VETLPKLRLQLASAAFHISPVALKSFLDNALQNISKAKKTNSLGALNRFYAFLDLAGTIVKAFATIGLTISRLLANL